MAASIRNGLALDRVPLGAAGDGPWAMLDEAGALLAVYEATGPTASGPPSSWPGTDGRPTTLIARCPDARNARTRYRRHHRGLRRGPPRPPRPARATCATGPPPRGSRSVVVTFDRHPAYVVRPDSAPKQLTSLDQKLELLADCGVDRTLVVPFDEERANETAEDFVKEVLVDQLGARLVVVGEDFHFGARAQGQRRAAARAGRPVTASRWWACT